MSQPMDETLVDPVERIRILATEDGQYLPEAFFFVSDAIRHTVEWIKERSLEEDATGGPRGGEGEFHVSGRELLSGIRRLAYERWGQLAPVVFRRWGVTRTEDFGRIVFLMVEDPVLGWKKRESDRLEDFAGGYDFRTAFSGWEG
jgi:uncharacterized repeat protein (TIGR04138 family)